MNTLLYFVRKQFFFVIIFFVLFCLFASFLLANLALTEGDKVVIDFFLSIAELLGVFIAIFFGSHFLFEELKNKTMYFLRSRRSDTSYYLIGKLLSLMLLALFAYGVSFLGLYFVIRIEMIQIDWMSLWYARILSYIKICVLISMTLFFSIIVSPYVNIIVMLCIYALGHAGQFLLRYTSTSDVSQFLSAISLVVFHIFPPMDVLSYKEFITTQPQALTFYEVLSPFLVGTIYGSVFFLLACILLSYKKKTHGLRFK